MKPLKSYTDRTNQALYYGLEQLDLDDVHIGQILSIKHLQRTPYEWINEGLHARDHSISKVLRSYDGDSTVMEGYIDSIDMTDTKPKKGDTTARIMSEPLGPRGNHTAWHPGQWYNKRVRITSDSKPPVSYVLECGCIHKYVGYYADNPMYEHDGNILDPTMSSVEHSCSSEVSQHQCTTNSVHGS